MSGQVLYENMHIWWIYEETEDTNMFRISHLEEDVNHGFSTGQQFFTDR